MPIKILEPSRITTVVTYEQVYDFGNGEGFRFNCDERGTVTLTTEAAVRNYMQCMMGKVDGREIAYRGMHKHTDMHRVPAKARCYCGEVIHLDGDTTCYRCGARFNVYGQEIK